MVKICFICFSKTTRVTGKKKKQLGQVFLQTPQLQKTHYNRQTPTEPPDPVIFYHQSSMGKLRGKKAHGSSLGPPRLAKRPPWAMKLRAFQFIKAPLKRKDGRVAQWVGTWMSRWKLGSMVNG